MKTRLKNLDEVEMKLGTKLCPYGMTTGCITRCVHIYTCVLPSSTPLESSNDETLDYCINNATNSLLPIYPASRNLPPPPSPTPARYPATFPLQLFKSMQFVTRRGVYTAFDMAANTRFYCCKTAKRPHIRIRHSQC